MAKKYSRIGQMVGEKRRRDYDSARLMPPLCHKLPGQPYDVADSEVVDWLVEQPAIRERVFYEAKQTGFIEYDPDDGVWYGIDY